MNHLSTEIMEMDVDAFESAIRDMESKPWDEKLEITRNMHLHDRKERLRLMREVLTLREVARKCFSDAWDLQNQHPVNVAKQHAKAVLKCFGPLIDAVQAHDHDEEEW